MSVGSAKALAELVDAPEIIPFLDRCGERTMLEVEDLLHGLVAIQGHPSPAHRARVRTSLLGGIWDRLYVFDRRAHMKYLILRRVEYLGRIKDLRNQELWVLANLWDVSRSSPDLGVDCEAIEGWDWVYLKRTYHHRTPSPDGVTHTAGRALYYTLNGDMSGMVSTHETAVYFGWEI